MAYVYIVAASKNRFSKSAESDEGDDVFGYVSLNPLYNILYVIFLQLRRGSSQRPRTSSGTVSNKNSKNSSKYDGDELQSPFEYEDEPTPRKRCACTLGVWCDV